MSASPRSAPIGLLLAVGLLLSAARPPHPGSPVYLEVEIGEGAVRCTLTGEQATVLPWLGIRAPRPGPMTAETRRAVVAAAAPFLDKEGVVVVDRKRLPATVDDASVPERHRLGSDLPLIQLAFRFECAGVPRSVTVAWRRFRGPGWPTDEPSFPVCFKFGRFARYELIYEDEPEYTWHRSPGVRAKEIDLRAVTSSETASLPVPVPSTLLLLAVVSSFARRRRRKGSASVLWSARFAAAALAVVLWNTGVVAMPNPLTTRAAIPPPAEALAMFEKLHGNIYRAFDAINEDQVYDLLAISVDRGILDDLYVDVYESLVLRRERGAMCTVDRIEVLERAIDRRSDPEIAEAGAPEFVVNWKWNVHGSVTHWGHRHERVNRYHARYRVRHDGRSWKISGVKVLDHQRVDKS